MRFCLNLLSEGEFSMGPLMYRQRPAYPALIGAVCVLVLGFFITCWLHQQAEIGESDGSSVLLVGALSCSISGALVILAFARYQFTHLWKRPDPAFSKKAQKIRDRGIY